MNEKIIRQADGVPMGSSKPMKLDNHGSCEEHQIQYDFVHHTNCPFCI